MTAENSSANSRKFYTYLKRVGVFYGLGRGIIVLWVAVSLVFIGLRVLPGDALTATLEQSGASREQIAEQRHAFCYDCPLYEQYGRYWWNLARGDWGFSTRYRQPVSEIIAGRLFPTFALALASLGVATLVGLWLGVMGSIGTAFLQKLAGLGIVAGQSVPIYLTAILLIYLFSVTLNWLPSVGTSSPAHLILPALTLGLHIGANVGRVLSASLRDAYAQPFMLTAKAKGLPPLAQFDHALRVALLPILSVLALQAGFLLGGTVIVETLFGRRGLGTLMVTAVLEKDYDIVQALVLLSAMGYLVTNALSNLARRVLDPR